MPRSTGRRVIGHAVDGSVCGRARTAGGRWSVRRRRDVVRHAIYRTAITIICLVVGVSDGEHSMSSSNSEDTVETVRRPVIRRDAVNGPSTEFRRPTAEDSIRKIPEMKIPDFKQSVSLPLFVLFIYLFIYLFIQ